MTPYRFMADAADELRAVTAGYEAHSAAAAARFVAAVDHTIGPIRGQPRIFGRVARGRRGHEVRQTVIPGSEFLLTYEVLSAEVVILSVAHAHRRTQPRRRRLP
ncbi:MAG: type II toxin-antitoxin system RelE/ParE family toxin [Gemmataceae bacterium]